MGVTIDCDLRSMFGPVRDQGARPTCLAFAASDAHAAARPTWVALSCEFAYYHALKRDGAGPTTGTTLGAMLTTIKEDGQPPEEVWAYLRRRHETEFKARYVPLLPRESAKKTFNVSDRSLPERRALFPRRIDAWRA